ncbi:CHAT domain-containing protein [Dactylosporangium sp. NPDC051541]|uniref:CHAT domain-containing protein n=1 Tax=Dactylosporangium sp. NPDC051541 TaxID=3363977 RepID=UPI0037956EB5
MTENGPDYAAIWHRMVHLRATDPAMRDSDDALARLIEQSLVGPATPTLLRILDARAVDGNLVSQDGCFTYIAATVAEQAATTSVEWLQQRFFARIVRLWRQDPAFADLLREASYRPDFIDQIAELDGWIDGNTGDTKDVVTRPTLAADHDPQNLLDTAKWLALLASSPRISQIPVEYLRIDPAALLGPPADLPEYEDDPDAYLHAAYLLLGAAKNADVNFNLYVEVRLQVALDLVRRRRFAKVRMLDLGWPELVQHVRMPGGIDRLRQLEARVLGLEEAEPAPKPMLDQLEDQRLCEFLRLPPLFRNIPDALFTRAGGAAIGGPGLETDWEPYINAGLHLQPVGRDGDRWRCAATFHTPSGTAKWDTRIDVDGFAGRAARLFALFARGPYGVTRDVVAAVLRNPAVVVDEIGQELWTQTFAASEAASSALQLLLQRGGRVRLTISSEEEQLTSLPWECLRIPENRVTTGLTTKLSVIRRAETRTPEARRPLTFPLRVLAVLAEPDGMPLPGAKQELSLLRECLAEAQRQGVASLTTISNASVADLSRSLQASQPHILHFTGHAMFKPDDGAAALVLRAPDGTVQPLEADRLARLLQGTGVTLAVLNGCHTGVNPADGTANLGICQAIISHGVPVAVATVRSVIDNAALRFAQEFYQAMVYGYPVEGAVAEARKGVFLQGWDWSAWAMFASNPAALDQIRLRRPSAVRMR